MKRRPCLRRPRLRYPRARRRGTSLVEMMVVIGLTAIVLGGVVTGAASLLKVDKRFSARNATSQLNQLTQLLRADIHAAESADWNEANQALTLVVPDEQPITYKLTGNRCQRTAGDTPTILQLPEGSRLIGQSAKAPALLEITIRPGPEAPPVALVAGLGSDRRLYYAEKP